MLKERILDTLRFFDLQDMPLTLLELHKYLITNREKLSVVLNSDREVQMAATETPVSVFEVLKCVDEELNTEVENYLGYYYSPGRKEIVTKRLNNYLHGINREKLIKRFAGALRSVPFVRGAALGGSQALGQQKETSDIDLFIVTDEKFMWIARTFVTVYFQVWGVRRHGNKIANRFCLNHYARGPKEFKEYRNLYTAMEYGRHRPLAYPQTIAKFHQNNGWWMQALFPNLNFEVFEIERQSAVQKYAEKIFNNGFGRWLENVLKKLQVSRIRKEQFILVEEDELSFHPESKQKDLLENFFNQSVSI